MEPGTSPPSPGCPRSVGLENAPRRKQARPLPTEQEVGTRNHAPIGVGLKVSGPSFVDEAQNPSLSDGRFIRGCLTSLFLLAPVTDAQAGHERDLSAPEPIEGEIALTDTPFCSFFVVQTSQGFSLAHWRGGNEIFVEGDRVRGPLHSLGMQRIEHVLRPNLLKAVGPLFTTVQIDEWGADLSRAQYAYYSRCFPGRYANKAVPGHYSKSRRLPDY